MPITDMYWASDWNRDRHVLRGQTSPDLSAVALMFSHAGGEDLAAVYIAAHPGDVELFFTPLFKGAANGDLLENFGLHFDITTGELRVDAAAPATVKNNFIVEVTATNTVGDTQFDELIRFHVHGAVTRLWLTPSTMTIHQPEQLLLTDAPYRFTARAQFDDGTVGDVTLNHGVTWAPAINFNAAGLFSLMPFNNAGDDIAVVATLPTPAGPQTANATLHIDDKWSAQADIPKVSIVPGGGWPGTLRPETAPNVLFFGDGFPADAKTSFETITNSLVHFMKSNRMMRPFDLLATSINFWRTFVPSPFGISVRSEVYVRTDGTDTIALPLPFAVQPELNEKWKLKNLVYFVGFPIPADAAKPNATLRLEWAALHEPDPGPDLTEALIDRWKTLAMRTFIDEIDAFPGMCYGVPPAANLDRGHSLDLHEDRGGVAGLRQLYALLASDSGVALDGNVKVGKLWAEDDEDAYDFDNTDLVVLISSLPGGRALNADGYIALSTDNGNIELPVTPVDPAQGRNAYTLDAMDIPTDVSADSSHTMTHELAHSFGVGDEYWKKIARYQDQQEAFTQYANLATETHVQDPPGHFAGAAIRWNWHRIAKAAMIEDDISEPSPNIFKIPLRLGHAPQFRKGDKLLLRLRPRGTPVGDNSTVLDVAKLLEVGIDPAPDSILVVASTPGTVTLPDLARFARGSIAYMPTPAPASAVATTPFAEMVALNVKNAMTTQNRPLTPVPCAQKKDPLVQTPNLNGVDLRGVCFKHKPRIVGLYEGGDDYSCGVYHPTGQCMMHHDHDEAAEFCAVCRYVIVDFVDPFLHWEIDRDYADIYPQPD